MNRSPFTPAVEATVIVFGLILICFAVMYFVFPQYVPYLHDQP